jgi:hypothetical protein
MLHDTTSCLRVLTVGFALPILICRCPAVGSEVNKSNRATAIFTLGNRGRKQASTRRQQEQIAIRTFHEGPGRLCGAMFAKVINGSRRASELGLFIS